MLYTADPLRSLSFTYCSPKLLTVQIFLKTDHENAGKGCLPKYSDIISPHIAISRPCAPAGNAELYLSWLDGETFETVTAPRYGSFHPWPLGGVLTWLRRRKMAARLQALQWADKSLDAVYAEVGGVVVLGGLFSRYDAWS